MEKPKGKDNTKTRGIKPGFTSLGIEKEFTQSIGRTKEDSLRHISDTTIQPIKKH